MFVAPFDDARCLTARGRFEISTTGGGRYGSPKCFRFPRQHPVNGHLHVKIHADRQG